MADVAIHLSSSARLVACALAEAHEVTVLALAVSAGVSKSTVAKTLVLLERAGAARRTIRETDDGAREADLWASGPGLRTLLLTDDGEGGGDGDGWGHARASVAGNEAVMSTSPVVECRDVEVGGRQVSDDGEVTTGFPGSRPASEPGDGTSSNGGALSPDEGATVALSGRLAPGGLAALVAAALAQHPDIDYTPTQLSHLLGGRSSGAIVNALEKMTTAGSAIRVGEKPKRYRHNA